MKRALSLKLFCISLALLSIGLTACTLPATPTPMSTPTGMPSATSTRVPISYTGQWDGGTLADGLLSGELIFRIEHDAVTDISFNYALRFNGCTIQSSVRGTADETRINDTEFSARMDIESGSQLIISGTFASAKDASGTLKYTGTWKDCGAFDRSVKWTATNGPIPPTRAATWTATPRLLTLATQPTPIRLATVMGERTPTPSSTVRPDLQALDSGFAKMLTATQYRSVADISGSSLLLSLPNQVTDPEIPLLHSEAQVNLQDRHTALTGFLGSLFGADINQGLEFTLVDGKAYLRGPATSLGVTDDQWYAVDPSLVRSLSFSPSDMLTVITGAKSRGLGVPLDQNINRILEARRYNPPPLGQLQVISLATQDASQTGSPALAASTNVTATVYSAVKTWGGSGATILAKNVVMDDSGDLYVVGEFQGTVNFDPAGPNPSATVTSNYSTVDAFLSKFDSNRNFQWVRTWGNGRSGDTGGTSRDAANGVAVDGVGNVYVAGLYQGTVDFGSSFVFPSNAPIGKNNIFVAQFNANGTTQWAHTWGGTLGGEAYSVAVDKVRGYVYVQGDWSTNPDTGSVDFNQNDPAHPDLHANHGFYDAFLSKFNLNGNFQWAKTWGGHGYDDGPAVTVDSSGNLYVCGMYGSTDINFDPAGTSAGLGHGHGTPTNDYAYVNVFLSKFDSNGNFQWVRTWGGLSTEDAGEAVAVDGMGNVYAGGRFQCTNCNFNGGPTGQPVLISTNGNHDAFVSKYDASGNFLWARTWGGSNKDAVGNLAVDGVNNVYASGLVSGITDQNGRLISSDASFTKLTSNGNWQWAKTWGGTGFDSVSGLAMDVAGNAYLTGWFQNTVDFDPDSGVDNHTATGTTDAFLTKFVVQWLPNTVYLPFIRSH